MYWCGLAPAGFFMFTWRILRHEGSVRSSLVATRKRLEQNDTLYNNIQHSLSLFTRGWYMDSRGRKVVESYRARPRHAHGRLSCSSSQLCTTWSRRQCNHGAGTRAHAPRRATNGGRYRQTQRSGACPRAFASRRSRDVHGALGCRPMTPRPHPSDSDSLPESAEQKVSGRTTQAKPLTEATE